MSSSLDSKEGAELHVLLSVHEPINRYSDQVPIELEKKITFLVTDSDVFLLFAL